jgi:hypothetical protein
MCGISSCASNAERSRYSSSAQLDLREGAEKMSTSELLTHAVYFRFH